jgi:hypothetical protein
VRTGSFIAAQTGIVRGGGRELGEARSFDLESWERLAFRGTQRIERVQGKKTRLSTMMNSYVWKSITCKNYSAN